MIYNKCIKIWREGVNEEIIKGLFVKFTYCSNKIENNETRLRDVEAIFAGEEVTNFQGNYRTIKEIENHIELCKSIFKLSEENYSKLSVNLIKHFNHVLMKGCSTEELLINSEDTGVSTSEIEKNLKSLINEVNNVQINEDNALNLIGYFTCEFESIQPFAYGNGLVARMVLNYILIENNLPPIVIFYNDKEKYYLALKHFKETKKTDKMVDFLQDQAYKTWIKDYNLKIKTLEQFLD